ncbi:MAG: hypothetical protein K2L50_06600 [Bacteroidales bacterium]|nr:hypothetical protein [Bacteroidales bacterium]
MKKEVVRYKGLFCLMFLAMFSSCNPESSGEDPRILWSAICKMDIQSKKSNNSKSPDIGIIGDSVSVHRLACYSYFMVGEQDSVGDMGYIEYQETVLGDGKFFQRDTINHTFSFSNDAVIIYMPYVDENGYGMPGYERIGWLISRNNSVFEGLYDTVLRQYRSPLILGDSLHVRWPYYRRDTLGYIPNNMAKSNRIRLLQLLKEKRFSEMMEIFNNDYTIYTCTGEEYRELVRLGLN